MTNRHTLFVFLIACQTVFGQFNVSECGVSKGCWIPDDSLCYGGCSGMGVSYRIITNTSIEFELFFKSDKGTGVYVAVGFSDDYFMGGESVLECSSIGDKPISMKFSYNDIYWNPEDNTNSRSNTTDQSTLFSSSTASYSDGIVYCKSIVDVGGSTNDPNIFRFDPTQQYFLLLVNGPTSANGLIHHDHDSTSPATYLHDLHIGFNSLHCGHTKGCAIPANCGGLGVSYSLVSSDQIRFEIFGDVDSSQNVWAAVGFSNDSAMGGESVIECSQFAGESLSVKFSYNSPKPSLGNNRIDGEPKIREQYIQQEAAFIQDGKLYCSATVNVSGVDGNDQIFKFNSKQGYYLLLASGTTSEGKLQHHDNQCVDTSQPVYLQDAQPFFDASECEKTKACFIPDDCPEGCDAMIASYRFNSSDVMFIELTARIPTKGGYVALGFSTNSQMGNNSVIECSSDGDADYSFKFSYNIKYNGHYNNRRVTADVTSYIIDETIRFVDGNLYCSAYVNVSGSDQDEKVFKFNPNQKYALLLAEGPTRNTTDGFTVSYHDMKTFSEVRDLTVVVPPTVEPPKGNGTFDTSTCYKTKGCVLPNGLNKFGVSYRILPSGLMEIELISVSAPASGAYVAVGFSKNGKMASSNVIECSSLVGQEYSVKFSFNDASPKNIRIDGENNIRPSYVSDETISLVDGRLYCRATVNVSGVDGNSMFFQYDASQKYYILLAKSSTNAAGLNSHGDDAFASTARLLSDYGASGDAASASKLVIAHAILMILAWFVFVPTAVLFARILRTCWPTLKPGGLLIWFHVHRSANIFAILLMIAAFALILTDNNWKWVKPSSSWGGKHAIIGLTAMILAWLQPFISTLRCTPDNPRRPLFNYVHRGIGIVAFVLATTAICIAAFHFTSSNHVVQLVLALIPLVAIFTVSIVFTLFDKKVKVNERNIEQIHRIRQLSVLATIILVSAVAIALSVLFGTGL